MKWGTVGCKNEKECENSLHLFIQEKLTAQIIKQYAIGKVEASHPCWR